MKNIRTITEEQDEKIVIIVQSRLAKGMDWNKVKTIIIHADCDVKVYKD